LSDEEKLTVRKILACAARMGGRFGKGMLASTLRGSRSAKLSQMGLDQLSTYGILSGMTQDEILLYVDALVAAGCLHVTGGRLPDRRAHAGGRRSDARARHGATLACRRYATTASHAAHASSRDSLFVNVSRDAPRRRRAPLTRPTRSTSRGSRSKRFARSAG
jgi:superfamily II DNA helicase RecQ